MWMLFLACAADCDPGFESREDRCYWAEQSNPQELLQVALSAPLPDPMATIERYQSWVDLGTSSCPAAWGGVWDTAGCTTQDGIEFLGKAVQFSIMEPEPEVGQVALDSALLVAATMRDGEMSMQAGGALSYNAERQAGGYKIMATLAGDFFETPVHEPWMSEGLGQSFFVDLDSEAGIMELEGGVSHAHADLYFDKVQVVDGCPTGVLLVHAHLADSWAELDWRCDCGVVTEGPWRGLEVCAPLAERSEELIDVLLEPLP